MNSDTPRTDKAKFFDNEYDAYLCTATHAEELERENNQLRADNEVLSESCAGLEMERQQTNAVLKRCEEALEWAKRAGAESTDNILDKAITSVQNALKGP